MKKCIIAIALVMLAVSACHQAESARQSSVSATETAVPIVRPIKPDTSFVVQLDYTTIYLFDNQSDFADCVSTEAALPVDFDKYFVLFVSGGSRPTTNYDIRVISIERDFGEKCIRVDYRETLPLDGAGKAMTYPCDVVLIPRDKLLPTVVVYNEMGNRYALINTRPEEEVARMTDEEMLNAMRDETSFFNRAAIARIAKSSDRAFAVKILRGFIWGEYGDVWSKKAAIMALGGIDDPAVLPALESILTARVGPDVDIDQRRHGNVLYLAAMRTAAARPGIDALLLAAQAFCKRPVDETVVDILRSRLQELQNIVKDPNTVSASEDVKNNAMAAYAYFRQADSFPVLVEYARATDFPRAKAVVRHALLLDENWQGDLYANAQRWYEENHEYISFRYSGELTFMEYIVDEEAKAAGVPLAVWSRIPEPERANWAKLPDARRKELRAAAEQTLEKLKQANQ